MAEDGTAIGNVFVRVGVDDLPAVNGLRNISNQVRTLTNSWKAQETYLKSVGDTAGAAEARFQGLGDTIQRQSEYVERLKATQERANEEIAKSKEQIESIKTAMSEYTTAEDRSSEKYKQLSHDLDGYNRVLKQQEKTYSSVGNKVEGAKNKLASLISQQERAKASMDYYASGADKVKNALKAMTTSSDLMIEKLRAEGKDYQANYEQSRLYANQLAKMTELHKRLASSLDSIEETQGKDSEAYRRTSSSLEKLDTQMAKTKASQDKLNESFTNNHLGIAKVRDSYDKMSNSVHKIGTGFKESAGKITNGAMIAGASIAGLSAGFVAVSEKAAKMQNTYKTTANLLETGGEKTAEVTKNVSEMQKQGRDLSLKYGKSQQSIAEAYQDLVKRGDSSTQALGAMNSMVQASVASSDDLKDVTQVTSNVMESFAMKVDKNGHALKSTSEVTKRTKTAVNELAFAADKTSTSFQNLGVGMSYVGATAHGAGLSLSETASAMGILSSDGLEADKAGTGLRETINHLTNDVKSIDNKDNYLNKLGIKKSDLVDSRGNLKSLSDVMGILGEKTKNMGTSEKNVVFNSLFGTTGQQAAEILAESAGKLKTLNHEVEDATKNNYVGKLADKNMDSAQNAMKRFKMVAQDVEMTLSSAVLPTVSKMAESMSRVADTRGFRSMVNTVGNGFVAIGNKLQSMFTYIDRNSDAFTSMGKSVATIIGEFGSGVWSAFSGTIKGIADGIRLAFGDKSSQNGAHSIANAMKDLASHKDAIKTIGEAFGMYFVASRMLKFASAINTVSQGVKGLMDTVNTTKGGNLLMKIFGLTDKEKIEKEATKDAAEIATDATKSAEKEAGKGQVLLSMFHKSSKVSSDVKSDATSLAKDAGQAAEKGAGKTSFWASLFAKNEAKAGSSAVVTGLRMGAKIVNGVSLGIDAFDIGKAFLDKGRKRYTDAGKGIGGLIGTGIGNWFGGPAGAALGGTVGTLIGNTIGKAVAKIKVKPPKISLKKTYDSLLKEQADYSRKKQSQEKKDLDVLLKNGLITKKEYQKQLKDFESTSKAQINLTKLSQSDRNALTKYYSEKRAKLESQYDQKIRNDKKKWDNIIYNDAKKFGADSEKVKADQAKREEAIRADENKKQAALEKQANDFTKKSTLEEAKLHETLTGKIKLETQKETSIYAKMVAEKGKLSNHELQTMLNDAQTEYNKVISLANQEYKSQVDTARKKRDALISAANRTRDEAIKAANTKYQQTVDAANREYAGTSKAATQQRNDIITKAGQQRDQAISAANDQHTKVVNHAEQQYNSAKTAAENQRDHVSQEARLQRDKVKEAAKEQSHGVVTHAEKQANSSMKASSKQSHGVQSIWQKLASFFDSLVKPFGVKPIHVSMSPTSYPSVGGLAYAQGGVANTGKALVGEAGPELRYKPNSGSYDILGTHGAELVDLQAGEEILNADDTQKLLAGNYLGTLPGYSKGTTSLSDFVKKLKNKADDIFKDIKDDALDAIKKIGDPIDKLKGIAKKAFNLDSVHNLGNLPRDISKGMVDKSIHGIGDFLKSLVDKVKDHLDSEQGAAGVTFGKVGAHTADWTDDIKKVAKDMKVDLTDEGLKAVLYRIQLESGGNQSVVNNWDSNARAGHPSRGLIQYIPSTFASYMMPNHTNINSGIDQLYALFNDSNWLRDIDHPGGWGPTGHRRFANGGIANIPSIFGEDGPEMAVPLASAKRGRGYELLGKLVTMFAKESPTPAATPVVNNDRVEELLEQNNKLMQALVNIVSSSHNDQSNAQLVKSAFYNAFGMDQRRANFQSI